MTNEIEQLFIDAGYTKEKASAGVQHALLSPYQTKVIYQYGEVGIAGYGSGNILGFAKTFGDSNREYAIKIGNYTECADNITLITGGNHFNESVLNGSLHRFGDEGALSHSKGPIKIGSNVTVSIGVTVLSGVTIGDGAVIGAGAVVTKDVPPFAIVAGNPAKIIRYRFSEEKIRQLLNVKWWDFSLDNIVKNRDKIDKIEHYYDELMLEKEHLSKKKDSNCYIVFKKISPTTNTYIGIQINDVFTPKEKLPEAFQFFMRQMNAKTGDKIYYVTNIFELSGLIS